MSGSDRVQAVFGSDLQTELLEKIGTASTRLEDIATEMSKAKTEDTARWNELNEERKAQADTLETLMKEREGAVREAETKAAIETAAEMRNYLSQQRLPSMAKAIGGNYVGGGRAPRSGVPEIGDGRFLKAVMDSRNLDDLDIRREAKADLQQWAKYVTPDDMGSKATLGATDATGGWLIPNATVADITKPGVHSSPILQLATVIRGVNAQAVDLPFRSTGPTRAVVIPWGNTKTNLDLTYNGYTATMYTLAQIYDISKQFARKSNGAAERDVMQELNGGLERGVAYYIFQGSGSSEPFGINAAIVTSPPYQFTTTSTHTASASTVAGNIATAVGAAAGALEARNRRAEAVIVGPAAYWAGITSGADAAGFYVAPGGANTLNPQGQFTIWGIPIYRESEYLAGSDDMLVGEFSAFKVFLGDGPRIDTSEEAGERWDKNLIGFRGELEMAFDARPAVYSGALQVVLDVVA